MSAILTLLLAITLPTGMIERAFEFFERGDYLASAQLLDQAAAIDREEFRLNNLHYLRGRVAEEQGNWARAEAEFDQVGENSVLHSLALWHQVAVAVGDGRNADALRLLDTVGPGFPDTLRLELAEGAPENVALSIYRTVSNRESRWKQSSILDDEAAMWQILTRSQGDEFALQAARRLDGRRTTPARSLRLAKTFHTHRIFDRAEAIYSALLQDRTQIGAEAHYQLGRTYFQRGRYDDAVSVYRATIERFPGTDWERNADEQIPPTYWRKLDYPNAIAAYETLIEKYDESEVYYSAVRDMVDVHRSMGNIDEAHRWIDQALATNPSGRDRAVLTFTRAKIHFGEGQYREAFELFQRLYTMRTGRAPNGTDQTETRFFEAASLEQLGRREEAEGIWRELSRSPFSYYGLRAIEHVPDDTIPGSALQQTVQRTMNAPAAIDLCDSDSNPDVIEAVRERRISRTRGFLTPGSGETDMVGELVFLRQWDEAFFWAIRAASRWRDQALADLAYLASDFRRSILYADRLRPPSDNQLFSLGFDYSQQARVLMGMLYPTAFDDIVCREAEAAGVNPLWLYAIIWQESRYDPDARSGASARGLMQFIPETATRIAQKIGMIGFQLDDLYQPEISIRLGAHYWAELMDTLGSPELALAAYNGGERNVERWRAKSKLKDMESFVSDIGFIQTKAYVRETFALYAKYAHLL